MLGSTILFRRGVKMAGSESIMTEVQEFVGRNTAGPGVESYVLHEKSSGGGTREECEPEHAEPGTPGCEARNGAASSSNRLLDMQRGSIAVHGAESK